MKYGTVCSGINAPAEAWNSLGWEELFCAEIEKFPSAVLKARHQHAPNLGDVTKYETWPDFGINLLAGGTPCQSFSLAGLRKGMDDPRGQLTRTYIEIAGRYRPDWLVWENVPGVLSADGGEAFAGFLAGLSGQKVAIPANGWGTFGIVPGITEAYGLAWRVLDTEYIRVDTHPRACPQRRERVFVVGHLGGCWQRAAAVLLERESLRGDSAPCRTTGKGFAASTAPSLTGSGHGVARPGESRGQDPVIAVAGTIGCLGIRSHSEIDGYGAHIVSHSLTGVGFDASEDGTGRGTPLVVAPSIPDVCGTLSDGAHNGGGLNGQDASTVRILPVVAACLRSGSSNSASPGAMPAVAFAQNTRDEVRLMGGDGSIVGALSAEPGTKQQCYIAEALAIQDTRELDKRQNGMGINADEVAYTVDTLGTQGVAHGFQPRIARNGHGNFDEGVVHALQASSTGKSDAAPCVATKTAVRRLTPTECARLQGFRDDYLDIIYNGKPAADGPKYKALGNAMSVNTMRWIGQRIQMVNVLPK